MGIHAGKDQEEREYAIRMFKEQRADRTLPLPLPLPLTSRALTYPYP